MLHDWKLQDTHNSQFFLTFSSDQGASPDWTSNWTKPPSVKALQFITLRCACSNKDVKYK